MMQLDQKETDLLKDLKNGEQLCVEKYTKYSSQANDTQLKNLFSQIAQAEQKHYDIISQMMNGTVPTIESSSGNQPTFSATYTSDSEQKKQDSYLCYDLLSTEKHVSALYDTCIFEFKTEEARNMLNQIQKQEQGHGKSLYDYMSTNNMYC
ncbi:MAG: ferritin-like domain-containing protein [Clostridiales bacterium]|nr:ferritin-like domain-containing protein [Clostridiales bacterium]